MTAYLKKDWKEQFKDIEGIIDLVQDALYDPAGPQMLELLYLAKEAGFSTTEEAKFRKDVKAWMKNQVEKYLKANTSLTSTQRDQGVKDMDSALSTLSDEEFFDYLGRALRGEADLSVMEDFIKLDAYKKMPNFENESSEIYNEI